MSMYGEYIAERTGDQILEVENGFATYRFPDEKTVYIVDIYIKPKSRNLHLASDIADSIVKIAKGKGCIKLLGSVVPSARGSTTSLRVLLGYGMTLDSSTQDFVLFRKAI